MQSVRLDRIDLARRAPAHQRYKSEAKDKPAEQWDQYCGLRRECVQRRQLVMRWYPEKQPMQGADGSTHRSYH
jgi:hypothetical protein